MGIGHHLATALFQFDEAPMFVARQLAKHQVGLTWNEVSRRYVDTSPDFFVPEMWRGRAANNKQGSTLSASRNRPPHCSKKHMVSH